MEQTGSLYSWRCSFLSRFPVSAGAFQTNYVENGGDSFDIGIMKFNSSGSNRVYATCVGGTGADSHSLIETASEPGSRQKQFWHYPYSPRIIFGSGGSFDIVVTNQCHRTRLSAQKDRLRLRRGKHIYLPVAQQPVGFLRR